jgi:hypothetical protein
VSPGDQYRIRLFVNTANASAATPDSDHGLAGTFTGLYSTAGAQILGDVTAAIKRMYREGRPITLTLVPDAGVRVSRYDGLYLALFTN